MDTGMDAAEPAPSAHELQDSLAQATFTVRAPAAPADAPLHPLAVLLLTVLVAVILSYVLLQGDGKQLSEQRQNECANGGSEPDEYFQRILNADMLHSWSGTDTGCRWTQTDDEVVVAAPLPDARAKEVACKVLPSSIALSVRGTLIMHGHLFRKVRHDECDWSIEEVGGERTLKVTLVKAVPTKGTQHWTSLLQCPEI